MAETGAFFDEFTASGLIDDQDVTIKSARFINWDYKGKVAQPVLGLQVILTDSEGTDHDDVLSAGDLRFFVPSSDGKKAIPVGNQTKLNINTNAAAFIISLMNADTKGELAAKLRGGDDISVLDGTKVHVVRVPQPKRAGIIQAPGIEGAAVERQKTQLTVNKVLAYAGGASAGATKAAPAAAAKAAAPAAAAASTGNEDVVLGVLLTIVAEAGGSIKRGAIAGKVFSNEMVKAMTAPEKNAILGTIVKDEFLGSQAVLDAGLTFDKAAGTVSLG